MCCTSISMPWTKLRRSAAGNVPNDVSAASDTSSEAVSTSGFTGWFVTGSTRHLEARRPLGRQRLPLGADQHVCDQLVHGVLQRDDLVDLRLHGDPVARVADTRPIREGITGTTPSGFGCTASPSGVRPTPCSRAHDVHIGTWLRGAEPVDGVRQEHLGMVVAPLVPVHPEAGAAAAVHLRVALDDRAVGVRHTDLGCPRSRRTTGSGRRHHRRGHRCGLVGSARPCRSPARCARRPRPRTAPLADPEPLDVQSLLDRAHDDGTPVVGEGGKLLAERLAEPVRLEEREVLGPRSSRWTAARQAGGRSAPCAAGAATTQGNPRGISHTAPLSWGREDFSRFVVDKRDEVLLNESVPETTTHHTPAGEKGRSP